MKFLIQKEYQTEVVVTLKRAQDYHAWKNDGNNTFEIFECENDFSCSYMFTDFIEKYPKEWCPIGSVQFVHNYYKKYFGIELKPINVPKELFPFAGRNIENFNLPLISKIYPNENIFVKSNDIEKWNGNGVYNFLDTLDDKFPNGNYQISELVDIISEYRGFVYQGNLLSFHYYLGDKWSFPSKNVFEDMIKSYINCPTCYTLDIAIINKNGRPETCVLEVHDFYACGLYGFQDLARLPFMYWRSHLDKINKL